jgi:hypothetical protein
MAWGWRKASCKPARASFTDNTLNFTGSQNWVDPLVGGRITGFLTPKVKLTVGGDLGGWGAGFQIDYQIFGALGYRIKRALALQAGYRYLYFECRKSSGYFLDNTTFGVFFGVTIALKSTSGFSRHIFGPSNCRFMCIQLVIIFRQSGGDATAEA